MDDWIFDRPQLTRTRMLMHRCLAIVASWVIPFTIAQANGADAQLRILPTEIRLSSTESRQTVVVQRSSGEEFETQVVKGIEWLSSDEGILKVEDGVAVPVGNGKTSITAKVGDQTASAEVMVTGMEKPFAWSFRNHVESVLSKQGCNGGACQRLSADAVWVRCRCGLHLSHAAGGGAADRADRSGAELDFDEADGPVAT
jgi:hypothetical protein